MERRKKRRKQKQASCAILIVAILLVILLIIVFTFTINKARESAGPENSPGVPSSGEELVKEYAAVHFTPTPDPPRVLPELRSSPQDYIIQPGDTLVKIAQHFQVTYEMIVAENNIENPNLIEVGQSIIIPAPEPQTQAPGFKIIPDSELINGPAQINFDLNNFLLSTSSYLVNYQEEYEDELLSGIHIINRVSREYSVNPRMLLAVIEFTNNCVTAERISEECRKFPAGLPDPARVGLYKQLAWTANELNRGYYLWRVNALPAVITTDGGIIPLDPTINAGTAAVQQLLSKLLDADDWRKAVLVDGFFQTYSDLFGYPFDYSFEPLLPEDLVQPEFQLPFEDGSVWSYTGGPHAGWGDGSAWAALDFAPPGDTLGCVSNDAWVVALSAGIIVYSDEGMVIQDLDGDGWFQTGWSILYMHIETRDRVQPGKIVKAGARIGHASCEGGISTGTHLHLARRYNGEWIPADQSIPFVLDNWTSQGAGKEYDGYLIRDNTTVEAINGKEPENQIQR